MSPLTKLTINIFQFKEFSLFIVPIPNTTELQGKRSCRCGDVSKSHATTFLAIENYHFKIGEYGSLSETKRRDYLVGILNRIEVQYDKESKEHVSDIQFKLPLVGDGIEYQDKKDKSKGYQLLDGDQVAGLNIPFRANTGKTKAPPNETIQR